MDGLKWKTLLKWMIWGYPYSRKHPHIIWSFLGLLYVTVTPYFRRWRRRISDAVTSMVKFSEDRQGLENPGLQLELWKARVNQPNWNSVLLVDQFLWNPIIYPRKPPMSFRWKCNICNTQCDTGILITPYHSPSLRKLMIHWISTHSGLKKNVI